MLKRILTALAVSLAAAAPNAAHAAFDKKVALVVGNAAYQNAPALANPVTDARAMAASFERLGFEIVSGFDLSKSEMEKTIREFARKSQDADLTTFFYAGHGMAVNDRNYMVPIDAKFQDAMALDFEAIPVDFVIKQMRYNDGVSLVFLDACRDNPLAQKLSRSMGSSTRSTISRGLAAMDVSDAGRGLAMAFATSPGEVAYDGGGKHSPFTEALLERIEMPGKDITQVMSLVTGDVLQSTDQAQRPWLNASLTGPVVLKPEPVALSFEQPGAEGGVQQAALPGPAVLASPEVQGPSQPRTASPSDDIEAQIKLFEFAQKSGKASFFKIYLDTYPNGVFAGNAKAEIDRLNAKYAEGASKPAATAAKPGEVEVAAVNPGTSTDAAASTAVAAGAAAGAAALSAPAKASPPTGFVMTDAMRAEVGNEFTEASIGMNRTKRREVQRRLNMVDANVGGADGMFGPRTRRGITFWQESQGLQATGYLTEPQLRALEHQTKEQYAAFQAQQRTATSSRGATRRATGTRSVQKKRATKRRATTRRATKRRATKRRATTRRATRQRVVRRQRVRRRRGGPSDAAVGAFVGGVVGGIIGGAISR